MSISSFAPSQQAQHFLEDDSGNTQLVYLYNGAIYIFSADEVGSLASGGSTSQWFIFKSADNGATWNNITPAMPAKFATARGQCVSRSGNQIFITAYAASRWHLYGFDLPTETWIADSPTTNIIAIGGNQGIQSATRANGQIVFAFGENGQANNPVYCMVYDPGAVAWTVQPTAIAALSFSQMAGGGIDSVNHAHFFAVQWDGGALGSGNATLQHFVVQTDDSITGPNLAYTFTGRPDQFLPWGDISEPVFYLDVTPATRKIAIAIGTRPNVSPFTGNITGLILRIATESDTPVWSTVTVPTGENFSQVTLANSQVTAMFVSSLLPIQFSGQTQLHIFWSSNGQAIQAVGVPWNNFLRHMDYADGVFSGITTEFSETNETMPGSLYPLLISNVAGTAQVGGFFPTIDYLTFTSASTKYGSLQMWWMSFTASGAGVPLSLSCNNPPSGVVAVPYNHGLSASGGTPPYTFAITAGALPPGLSLDSAAGNITGTPTVFGVFSFTVQVTDSAAATASVTCTISIAQTAPYDVSLAGGTGCVPTCIDISGGCRKVESMGPENRGGDPAILMALLAMLVVLEGAE